MANDAYIALIGFFGVIIGGAIVTLGQVLLFERQMRKEKERDSLERRREAIKVSAATLTKAIFMEADKKDPKRDEENPIRAVMDEAIARVNAHSDDEISALLGIGSIALRKE